MPIASEKMLSICIPTYNRAAYLSASLERLFCENEVLSGSVEVIVADNCSSDDTRIICERYQASYPNVFFYYRQSKNIGPSGNFTFLLKQAKGLFLKFQNDNLILRPGAIGRMLGFIREHESEHPVIYFGSENNRYPPRGIYRADNCDEFLDKVSYLTTWTGGYGMWRDEVDMAVEIHDRLADTLLQQVGVIWTLFLRNKIGYFVNESFLDMVNMPPLKKDGYNVSEVFGNNYPKILMRFVGIGMISQKAYDAELRRVYCEHVFPKYFDFYSEFSYTRGGFWQNTARYHGKWYFWMTFIKWPIFKLLGTFPFVDRIIRKLLNRRMINYSSDSR